MVELGCKQWRAERHTPRKACACPDLTTNEESVVTSHIRGVEQLRVFRAGEEPVEDFIDAVDAARGAT